MVQPLPVKTLRFSDPMWALFGQLADKRHLTRADLLKKYIQDDIDLQIWQMEQRDRAEQDDDG